MKRAVIAVAIVAIVIGGLVATYITHGRESRADDAARRLHTYCTGLRNSFEADRQAFTLGDEKTKQLFGQVFSNALVFTSLERVDLCSSHPPDLHLREVCWIKADYDCLARLAASAHDAIDY